jgi:lysophospholipase L1-like esterase
VIAFIPEKFRVFQPFCRFPPESECRSWVVNDLPDRLRDIVRSISADIRFLDLTSYLQDGVKKGVLPYYPDDSHWSEEGHRFAAEAIHEYLRSVKSQ